MWLLSSQAMLSAANGVTFTWEDPSDRLRGFCSVLAMAGLVANALALVRLRAIIKSKQLSWKVYRELFGRSSDLEPARPYDG